MKNYSNSGSVGLKKSLNLTTQVADTIGSINKKSTLRNRTTKLIKTLTYQPNQNSNVMTQEDIDKLFGRCGPLVQKCNMMNKQTTQVTQAFVPTNYRNFTASVKFLIIQDEYDKFLTGLPQQCSDQDRIDRLFINQSQEVDLTLQFKKNYLVGKIIGQGAYASVRVAIYKPHDRKIAIKIYQKNKIREIQRKKSVRRQIKILQLLNHQNIVKILDVVQTNNHLNIVMQYLSGISLSQYLKSQPNNKISERNCKKIFKYLAKALKYMHSLFVAHRDIKLQNIILDQQLNPKIIDFGFSTCIQSDKKIKIFCGTPSYMAPQVVQKKQYRGENADIWALGVMLFVCLTGIFPFKGSTDQQLYKKINNSEYPKGQLLFSRTISDLISKMLKINPEQRITASQILKHPWFAQTRNESNKTKNTQSSLDNRKRINTLNSTTSKESKWAHKTGLVKKALIETTTNQNLQIQIKMAIRSPKMQQQVNSYRLSQKQNIIKYLKSEKNSFRTKQNTQNKEREKDKEGFRQREKQRQIQKYKQKEKQREKERQRQKQIEQQKQKQKQRNKTHSKIIDLLKIQMKKRESDKQKHKKK